MQALKTCTLNCIVRFAQGSSALPSVSYISDIWADLGQALHGAHSCFEYLWFL